METVYETTKHGLRVKEYTTNPETAEICNTIGNNINSFNATFSGIEAETRGKILRYLNTGSMELVPESSEDEDKIYVIDNDTNTCYLTSIRDSKSFISFRNLDLRFVNDCLVNILKNILRCIPAHRKTTDLMDIKVALEKLIL